MARFLHPKEHGSWRERVTIEEKVWSGPAPYAARVGTPHRPSSALTAENLGYHTVNYSEAMKANALELQRLNSSVGKPPRPAAAVASVARALGRDLLPEDLLKPPPVAPYASTASGSPERFRATSAQRFPLPRQLMSKFRSKSGQPVNDPLSELGPLAPPTSNGTYGRHVGVTMSTLNVQQQLAVQAQLHEELTGSGASIGKLSQRPVVTPDDRRTRSPEEKERLENAVHSLADKVDQIEAAIRAERAQRTVLRQRVNHLAALASTMTGEPNLTQQRNGRPNTKVKPAKSEECPQIAKPFSPNADPAFPPRLTSSQLREGTEGIRKQGRGVFPHFAVPL